MTKHNTKQKQRLRLGMTIILGLLIQSTHFSQTKDTIAIWSNISSSTKISKPSSMLKNQSLLLTKVSHPAMVVFEPEASKHNGAGIIVCPGGGYWVLAIDKEGYEVAKWLNSLGFTAFVLQYSVPQRQEDALKDIQRAIRMVRAKAVTWKLKPDKLGVLGFSAGGSLCARASTRFTQNNYAATDTIDNFSSRPDFSVLIYPAYLDKGENRKLSPELTVNENSPPMFIFGTADDPHGNSALVMATALRDAEVPVTLHLLSEGGHGYGLRPGNRAAETWPVLAAQWLKKIITN